MLSYGNTILTWISSKCSLCKSEVLWCCSAHLYISLLLYRQQIHANCIYPSEGRWFWKGNCISFGLAHPYSFWQSLHLFCLCLLPYCSWLNRISSLCVGWLICVICVFLESAYQWVLEILRQCWFCKICCMEDWSIVLVLCFLFFCFSL